MMFLAQEICVGYSSYPTPEIDANAKAYRQLGLGYANLGALLMARGSRTTPTTAAPTRRRSPALMTGRAYRKSAEVAHRMGAFAGYRPNAAAMIGVIAKHRAAVGNIQDSDSVPEDLLTAARQAWDDALDLGEVHGYRNAQATVLAPTGTISFMMDCDTTGVEPDFSLVKSKKLVGGGEITIVNKTVPMALEKLGYAPREVDEVVAFIDERNTIVGAPNVKTRALPGLRLRHRRPRDPLHGSREDDGRGAAVHLRCDLEDGQPARGGDRRGRLTAADRVVAARRQGDRDLPRQLQGRAAAVGLSRTRAWHDAGSRRRARAGVAQPKRRRVPDDRVEVGRKFKVGDYEGYIHVGLFEDGTPGDIFVDIAKEGTTLAGLMNSFMISVSLGLQYGVPLEVYVSKFSHMRFEPSGLTNDADIRIAKSIVDYIFRWMGKKFLTTDQQEEAGILSPEVKARLAQAYAPVESGQAPASRGAAAGPDRALQHLGGRGRVRPLRRPDGPHGLVLHVPRLRHEHRLQLTGRHEHATSPGATCATNVKEERPRKGGLSSSAERDAPEVTQSRTARRAGDESAHTRRRPG